MAKKSSPSKKNVAPTKADSKKATASPKKKSAALSSSKPARSLSDADIGETAGGVWRYLESEGPATLTAIKKNLSDPNDLIVAAIGWLAREDKLLFTKAGRTLKVSLK